MIFYFLYNMLWFTFTYRFFNYFVLFFFFLILNLFCLFIFHYFDFLISCLFFNKIFLFYSRLIVAYRFESSEGSTYVAAQNEIYANLCNCTLKVTSWCTQVGLSAVKQVRWMWMCQTKHAQTQNCNRRCVINHIVRGCGCIGVDGRHPKRQNAGRR